MTNVQNWKPVTLGDVAKLVGGGTPSRSVANFFGGEIDWVTPTDLSPIGEVRELGKVKDTLTDEGLRRSSARLLPTGTVLYSSRASIGKIAVADRPCTTNQGFANFIPRDGIVDSWFLAYYLCHATPEILPLAGETTYKEISKAKLSSFPILLPSSDEQRRIVNRIKECLSRVDEIKSLRNEAQDDAKALLESVRFNIFGAVEKVPDGWTEKRLDELADVIYGISAAISGNRDSSLGTPIIRMANMSLDGKLDLSDMRYLPITEAQRRKFLLERGDLLLNWRSGSPAHIGKTALFDNEGDFTCASFILRIRAYPNKCSNRYLRHVLNFMRERGYFVRRQRMQVNAKLNATEFSGFPIRIPPTIKDQERIADQLDAAETTCDRIRSEYQSAAKDGDLLQSAVLRKAFAGEL